MPSFEFEIATPAALSSALVASYCCLPHGVIGGIVFVSNNRSLLPHTPEISCGLNAWSFNLATASVFLLSNTQRGQGRQLGAAESWAKAAVVKVTSAINIQITILRRITELSSVRYQQQRR